MNHSTPLEEEELVMTFAHRMRMALFQSRLQRTSWRRHGSLEMSNVISATLGDLITLLRTLPCTIGTERINSIKLGQEFCIKLGMYAAMLHDYLEIVSAENHRRDQV